MAAGIAAVRPIVQAVAESAVVVQTALVEAGNAVAPLTAQEGANRQVAAGNAVVRPIVQVGAESAVVRPNALAGAENAVVRLIALETEN